MVVHSLIDLGVCDKLRMFAEHLSTLPLFGEPGKEHLVSTIGFGSDGKSQVSFSFDRRAGVPFSENRYYTRAALPTADHQGVLDKFEQMLSAETEPNQ